MLHNFWIWDYDNDEKEMLEDMLQYFENSWDVMKGKKMTTDRNVWYWYFSI